MAMLKCEICGGSLVGKPGGIYECEFCGVQYDLAWAKAKIQEITGTVKVEGTVQVAGTVKVEGSANLESFLKRGYYALEDKKWDEAKTHFNEALNINAECAEAYLGLVLASLELENKELLSDAELNFEKDSNFIKAMRFADTDLKAALNEILEKFRPHYASHLAHLAALRERAAKVEKLLGLARDAGDNFFVKSNGTIQFFTNYANNDAYKHWNNIVAIDNSTFKAYALRADGTVVGQNWTDIAQISIGNKNGGLGCAECLIGVKTDGTMVSTADLDFSEWSDMASLTYQHNNFFGIRKDGTVKTNSDLDLSGWTDVVAIVPGTQFTVGLRADGTVLLAGKTELKIYSLTYDLTPALKWRNIVSLHADGLGIVGLKADGTMVAVGKVARGYETSTDVVGFKSASDMSEFVYTVCIKKDGTAEHNGKKLGDARIFEDIDNLEQERREAMQKWNEERIAEQKRREEEKRRKKEEEERIAREQAEKQRLAELKRQEEERIKDERRSAGLCQHCGGELKGFFSKKCVSCGKPKDY